MIDFKEKANLIWSVADLLRGGCKQADYGKVILPMIVLRRLDSVMGPTKQKVLAFLRSACFLQKAHKADRTYQFRQEGVHPERIQSEEVMRQKVEYIHNNPVARGYVDRPEHWRYSSARNYLGMEGLLEVCTAW
jgi:type I restriction-modification system DNA methylase subunit